jgi:hypothetical protein
MSTLRRYEGWGDSQEPIPDDPVLEEEARVAACTRQGHAAYTSYRGVWDVGCWGKDVNGNAFIVVPQMQTQSMPLSVLPLADVQDDRNTMTIKSL